MQSKKGVPGASPSTPRAEPTFGKDPVDPAFAPTEVLPLEEAPARPATDFGGLSLAPVEVSLYEVLAEIRKNNRSCPQPTRWLQLYRILLDAAHGRSAPPPPVSGSAWASTSALSKRGCLREHVEWAADHGCLQPVYEFLKSLPDSDWHHIG